MIKIFISTSCLITGACVAQDYTLISFTIDSGGQSTRSAGAYTLAGTIAQHDAAAASSAGMFQLQSGFWSPTVATPCPGDITGDGELNFFDVSAFLAAFTNMDPVADFTGDGQFNFFDVSTFLSAYTAGCP